MSQEHEKKINEPIDTGEPVEQEIYPLLALRDLVVYPGATVPLLIGRPLSLGALAVAPTFGQKVALITQRDSESHEINMETLYHYGVIGEIIEELPFEGKYKILVDAIERVKLVKTTKRARKIGDERHDFVLATVEAAPIERALTKNLEDVYVKVIKRLFSDYAELTKVAKDLQKIVDDERSLEALMLVMLENLNLTAAERQEILEEETLKEASKALIARLTEQIDIAQTQKRIQLLVQNQVSKNQREYYLNEQMKAISKELDDLSNNGRSELDQLEEDIRNAKMPKEAEEKGLAEIKRLRSMPTMSAEGTVSRTYIDWLLKMPWNERSRLRYGLVRAQKVLDNHHSGLQKVKDHILEHLAVISHTRTKKGNVLCFIGPPGVGKTSLARSIAEATGREFVRMSLGGVRDEAEIRGHRRTYIGAMPGKLVQLLSKAKTKNPLILLDELDKTASDHRGDPADALLEVLDPEQNDTFMDHYLDTDVDLSEVMFIATANSYNIPPALRDRMDIIELSSYTELEKLDIAKEHLIPKVLSENKIEKSELRFSDEIILALIQGYTKEAGVRNLTRLFETIVRKFIKERLLDKEKRALKLDFDEAKMHQYLGAVRYSYGEKEKNNEVGYVNGLAWTSVGGDLLGIEVELMPGNGQLITTGSLGDVMKESMRTALTVIRARSNQFDLPIDFHKQWDIHVHAPDGATPKDGPSAGSAITLAMLSALLNIPVRSDIAMTGEVSLRGHVLPIGGLKEKLIAAERAGIREVLIPKKNEKNLEDVPENVLNALKITLVESIDEVFDAGLTERFIPKTEVEPFSGFYPLPKRVEIDKNKLETV